MSKLKNNKDLMELIGEESFREILFELFPRRVDNNNNNVEVLTDEWNDEWTVTKREVKKAIKKEKNSKALGPDGIPPMAFKEATDTFLEKLRAIYNDCLKKGTMPADWKVAKVVLIPKKSGTTIE